MAKRLKEVKVTIQWFEYVKKTYGGVELGVLKPAKKYESVEIGSPIEVLLAIIEKSSKSREGDYFEVKVEAPGIMEVMGESPRYRAQRPLFPRPARLKRVGILTRERITSSTSGTGGEYASFNLGDLEWFIEEDEVYVYEGVVNADDDVIIVYLDTSEGPRTIIPGGRDRILRDVLSRQQSSGG